VTDAECTLWRWLRAGQCRGVKFRRQEPIAGYIADFVAHAPHLAIEVDGGQHAFQTRRDATRTAALEARGYTVLRFWNTDVLTNPEGVVAVIIQWLDANGTG